jgi:hypothetical protein
VPKKKNTLVVLSHMEHRKTVIENEGRCKSKGKFFPVHPMKACKESGFVFPLILTPGTR